MRTNAISYASVTAEIICKNTRQQSVTQSGGCGQDPAAMICAFVSAESAWNLEIWRTRVPTGMPARAHTHQIIWSSVVRTVPHHLPARLLEHKLTHSEAESHEWFWKSYASSNQVLLFCWLDEHTPAIHHASVTVGFLYSGTRHSSPTNLCISYCPELDWPIWTGAQCTDHCRICFL